ncbi:MAG TPA: serine hydrolase domain-containing protein [Acidimicrobiia bacterium]|nr:serine hydrolase domain-containing protein [Acidimicrobiia bacterium]
MTIHGECHGRFGEVRDEFERNFSARDEIGASVCVTVDGETVVDLWGGAADPAAGRAWERDTIGVVWSCTKGATALCAHMLAARGLVDLDSPVATYWPEFAPGGKDAVTVRMALAHQAGLAAFREPIPDSGYLDWEGITDRLAREEPLWQPGTRHGYHALTYGHLIGEVVRRVSGASIGTFFRDEVARPLDLDFAIGLPPGDEPRVAPTIPTPFPEPGAAIPSFYRVAMTDPTSIAAMVLMHSGAALMPGFIDTREAHAAELPAFGGIANARALAGMYRVLAVGGAADGVRLVDAEELGIMGAVASATAVDATMLVPTRWTSGFVKSVDNRALAPGDRDGVIMSETAFGHVGMGGSLGFADPGPRLSFGYTMNRQALSVGIDARGQSLVDATYRALGYTRPARGGSWYR